MDGNSSPNPFSLWKEGEFSTLFSVKRGWFELVENRVSWRI